MESVPGPVMVESLTDVAAGIYVVSTQTAAYEMDLTRMLYLHTPRSGDARGSLRRDGVFGKLLGVCECTVGRPMHMWLYFHALGAQVTIRTSAEVVSIEQIHNPKLKPRLSWGWRRAPPRSASSRTAPWRPAPSRAAPSPASATAP